MKRMGLTFVAGMFAVALTLGTASAKERDREELKVGDTAFITHEGNQGWPKGDAPQAIGGYSVPIYIGLPDKSYKVLGRIYDTRTEGFDVVGRAFDEGLGKESRRLRNCANQARLQGADAVVVTEDPNVLKAFGLSDRELRRTAPLFRYKHSIVLAVKF